MAKCRRVPQFFWGRGEISLLRPKGVHSDPKFGGYIIIELTGGLERGKRNLWSGLLIGELKEKNVTGFELQVSSSVILKVFSRIQKIELESIA